jgi:hypothetical protein
MIEARWGRDRTEGYLIYGACRCGSTAWETWKRPNERSVSYAYDMVKEELEVGDDETPPTPLAALGVITRAWGRRILVGVGWIAGLIVVPLFARSLWKPQIDAFLASRPTWGDLFFAGWMLLGLWGYVSGTLRRRQKEAPQRAARKRQRARTLKAAWAVLRPAQRPGGGPADASDAPASRGP